MNAYDLGWGDPRRGPFTTVPYDVGHGIRLNVRNTDVGTIFAELVRRLEAERTSDGSRYWMIVGPVTDDWGSNRRLKRWAEALGHTMATAPLDEFSDHSWATACDFNTVANPMLDRRPADPWAHTDMPRNTAAIAADLLLDWGGNWSEPYDPQHFALKCTPAEAADLAARIRDAQEDDMADPQVIELLAKIESNTRHADTILTTILTQGFRAQDANGQAAPTALNGSIRGVVAAQAETNRLLGQLVPPAGGAS